MIDYYINGRFLTQPITGINRFAYELSRELGKLLPLKILVPKGRIHTAYNVSEFNIIEYGKLKSQLWEQVCLPIYFFGKKNYLLLNFSGLGPVLITSKITTIHDISFLRNPGWFSKRYYLFYKLFTPLAIRTSLKILTVSDFSKSEIIFYYKIPSSKIEVIHNAVIPGYKPLLNEPTNKKYVLTVGSLDPRKNFSVLLKVFQDIRMHDIDLHIVGTTNKVFGNLGFKQEDYPNIKFLGRISDEQLAYEYANASLFILPSLYEGFGIPPLEALNYNCPIILSDIPVFHEIFENAAFYFDPNNINDIIMAITGVLNGSYSFDNREKDRIISKYSWNKSAAKLYHMILQM